MSRDGKLALAWPDQAREYRLRLGELRQLQEKCDAGPLEIMARIQAGRWRVDDVYQTIRLGLIGAGMRMDDALTLVDLTVTDGRLGECAIYAQAILSAAVTGPPDEKIEGPRGRRNQAAEKTEPARAGLSGKGSTPKRPSSDGRRTRSRK